MLLWTDEKTQDIRLLDNIEVNLAVESFGHQACSEHFTSLVKRLKFSMTVFQTIKKINKQSKGHFI